MGKLGVAERSDGCTNHAAFVIGQHKQTRVPFTVHTNTQLVNNDWEKIEIGFYKRVSEIRGKCPANDQLSRLSQLSSYTTRDARHHLLWIRFPPQKFAMSQCDGLLSSLLPHAPQCRCCDNLSLLLEHFTPALPYRSFDAY
jgi:hypothetical protein